MVKVKKTSPLEKCFTIGKMGHTHRKENPIWKNESHFRKWVTLGKMSHTQKNKSHLKNRIPLRKMGHPQKKGTRLINEGQSQKNGSHLEKQDPTWKRQIGHTLKHWVTLWKMGHTWIIGIT